MSQNGSPELLIVMAGGATPEQTEHVVARLHEVGVDARVSRGREKTVISAIGERELLATLPLEAYPGVEQVLPILKPYKLVSREIRPDPTVIEARASDRRRLVRADRRPVHRRDREQTLETARVGGGCGRDDAPRRRVQAAHVALRIPGPRRGGAVDPPRGERRDRVADRHRAARPPAAGRGGRGRRRDPDRRAQHAELPAPLGDRPCRPARPAQARPVRIRRGAVDGSGIRRKGGERAHHPLRARDPDVRALDAVHARPRLGRGPEAARRTCR